MRKQFVKGDLVKISDDNQIREQFRAKIGTVHGDYFNGRIVAVSLSEMPYLVQFVDTDLTKIEDQNVQPDHH